MEVMYDCNYILERSSMCLKEHKNNSTNTEIMKTVKSTNAGVKEILWQRIARVFRHSKRLLPNLKEWCNPEQERNKPFIHHE